MRAKGKISSWNDAKGYGFIDPYAGGDRVFAHIKAFSAAGRRPVPGDVVTYTVTKDNRGRSRADAATIAGISRARPAKASGRSGSSAVTALFVATGFLLLVAAASWLSLLPSSVLTVYCVLSAVAFLVYASDKSAAEKGAWRTPEETLHMLALVGGWPGALVAQQALRHKSSKQSFRTVFWMTVILNLTGLGYLFTVAGADA